MLEDTLVQRKLESYLGASMLEFGRLQHLEKFADGQSNPTYLLITDRSRYVLRTQPTGNLLKSAHAVDREFKVLQALYGSAVPVPKPYHLCLDKDVLGGMFYIMSYCDGRVHWDPALPSMSVNERRTVYMEMCRVLAAIHSTDINAVGLAEFGKPGNYFARQIERWARQYLASETTPLPGMSSLLEWLPNNVPDDDGEASLIHGDFRIDNFIFSQTDHQMLAVLDWELSTLGHPLADLAYQCMQWRLQNTDVIPGLGELDRKALGLPSEEEYIEMYCQYRGINKVVNWRFYLIFSFFRFAAILQGVMKRALDGNASSKKAIAYGELAPVLSQMGFELLQDSYTV